MGIGATTGRSGRLRWKIMLLVLGLSLLVVSTANATLTDLFIKFQGIDGESTEKDHGAWSNILSVKWGVSAVASNLGSGSAAGKPVFDDLSWTQVLDKSFPPLFGKIAAGNHISKVNIDFASPSGEGDRVYFQMEFHNVLLTSLGLIGDTSAKTTMSGAFAYDTIAMTYLEYGPDGAIKDAIEASYDLRTHMGSVGDLASLFALGLSGPTTTPAVPIPASLFLFGSGLAGLAGLRRKLHR